MINEKTMREFVGTKRQKLTARKFIRIESDQVWLFDCECGNTIEKRKGNFLRSISNNCGCDNAIRKYEFPTRNENGKWPKIYQIWVQMRQRCNNKNNPNYSYYGKRGIKVCRRWDNFQEFFDDMNDSFEQHRKSNLYTTLDRIDVNKGYSPKNCRWATRKEQSRNCRRTVHIKYRGVSRPVGLWAEILPIEINYQELYKRVFTRSWDIERAFTQPMRKSSRK